jgi:hypothetical protein
MNYIISILSVLLLIQTVALAEIALPNGWRKPTNDEITDDMFKARSKDPNRHLAAKADFNGDGIIDTAIMLVNDAEDKMGLFVFISKEGNFKSVLLEQIEDKTWVDAMGLSVVEPGRYKTACGKGYWDCPEGVPEILDLKRPAINFFKFESANSFFVCDKSKNSFKRIWMSD